MTDASGANAPSRWATLPLLAIAAGFVAVTLTIAFRPLLYFYDDGVYYEDGLRFAGGDRPYTDFYLAHPPAVMWTAAAAHWLGIGIFGCRMFSLVLGVGFLIGLAAFVRRSAVDVRGGPVGLLAAVFLSATALYIEATSQVLTQLPGMALTLAGFFLLSRDVPRPALAGVLLALGSLYRIQVAYIAPAWCCYLVVVQGWRLGWRSCVWLAVGAAVPAAVLHGWLAALYPEYLDCVLRSHLQRPSTSIGQKIQVLTDLFREPQVAVGLMAAVVLSATGRGLVRGLAVFTTAEVVLTLFASRFLMDGYFLPCYPYLFACAAILIGREAERARAAWPAYLAAGALILVCCGIPTARMAVYRMTQLRAFERDLIARVSAAPGEVVLCTPAKIPLFAGKRMVKDYHTPDTTSPLKRDFGAWFVKTAERVDIVVLNDIAMRELTPAQCLALSRMNKSIVFGEPQDEAEFRRRIEIK